MCLKVWFLVDGSIWEVMEPVGGSVLLEEGHQLGSALRYTPMPCFLYLLPVKMKVCSTYLSTPVIMHAVPIMVDPLVHKLKSQQKKSNSYNLYYLIHQLYRKFLRFLKLLTSNNIKFSFLYTKWFYIAALTEIFVDISFSSKQKITSAKRIMFYRTPKGKVLTMNLRD